MFARRHIESTDPDEFFSLIRPNCHNLTVVGRGQFQASATLIEGGRLYAQRRSEHLGRMIQVNNPRPGILFLTTPGPPIFCNGFEIGYGDVLLCGPNVTFLSRLSGHTNWASMTLSADDMEAISTSYFGGSQTHIDGLRVITPPAAALAHLRSMHECIESSIEAAGELLDCGAAQRRLEQILITAMLNIINEAGVRSDTMARQHHHIVINRFFEILDANLGKSLNMQVVSKEIGISSRTFRMACQEQLGICPTQYLLLRRMGLARRALQQNDPTLTTVTDIATELGFWELGRFAVKYHEIFGETPSTTLRDCNSKGTRFRIGNHVHA